MAKYSFEFKMEVVQAYLNAEGGYRYFKEAEITYSKLLWTNNLTEGSET